MIIERTTCEYKCDICDGKTATYEELIHIPVEGLSTYVDVCHHCNNERMSLLTGHILRKLANV
jgi:hypothetical protein